MAGLSPSSALRLVTPIRASAPPTAYRWTGRGDLVPAVGIRTAFYNQSWRGYARTADGGQRGHNGQQGYGDGRSGFRKWSTRLLILLAFPATYLLGSVFPPQVVLLLYPRFSPPPPDKDSKRGKALTNDVERELQNLGITHEMRDKVKGRQGWYETRPYAKFDPQKVHNSLTAGTLRGPGKLAITPLLWAKEDESEAVAVLHFGRALCGHDGIIHGGLIATTFDETLARNALLNLNSHIGVTASLTIDYKSPCMADQFVVLRTKLDKVDGRKVWVSGSMETLEGVKVAESRALFIEPKWAQFLQSSGVTEAMGRPIPLPEASPSIAGGNVERVI